MSNPNEHSIDEIMAARASDVQSSTNKATKWANGTAKLEYLDSDLDLEMTSSTDNSDTWPGLPRPQGQPDIDSSPTTAMLRRRHRHAAPQKEASCGGRSAHAHDGGRPARDRKSGPSWLRSGWCSVVIMFLALSMLIGVVFVTTNSRTARAHTHHNQHDGRIENVRFPAAAVKSEALDAKSDNYMYITRQLVSHSAALWSFALRIDAWPGDSVFFDRAVTFTPTLDDVGRAALASYKVQTAMASVLELQNSLSLRTQDLTDLLEDILFDGTVEGNGPLAVSRRLKRLETLHGQLIGADGVSYVQAALRPAWAYLLGNATQLERDVRFMCELNRLSGGIARRLVLRNAVLNDVCPNPHDNPKWRSGVDADVRTDEVTGGHDVLNSLLASFGAVDGVCSHARTLLGTAGGLTFREQSVVAALEQRRSEVDLAVAELGKRLFAARDDAWTSCGRMCKAMGWITWV